jgi:hypothetical protein
VRARAWADEIRRNGLNTRGERDDDGMMTGYKKGAIHNVPFFYWILLYGIEIRICCKGRIFLGIAGLFRWKCLAKILPFVRDVNDGV